MCFIQEPGRFSKQIIVRRLILKTRIKKMITNKNRSRISRWLAVIWVAASFTMLSAPEHMAAGPAYPLKIAPGQHYVVDQKGVPFLIQGDSPWYLTEVLNASEVDYYLSNRCAQGYNSILLDITELAIPDGISSNGNLYGQLPFTSQTGIPPYTNLLSWNTRYFTNVDWVIQRAGYYGICVFAYPLYDDYGGVGWYAQMARNPTNSLYSYGQFIGNHYKNFTNLVWIGVGDYDEPGAPSSCLWNYIAAGIASTDPNHIISAQAQRPNPATYYSAFVTYNCSYGSLYPYIESLANYQRTPVLASFAREPYYEYSSELGPTITSLNSRQFAWWAVLSGDMGQFFGNAYQWYFTNGWQSEMFSPASVTIPYLSKLLNTRRWYNFVPDAGHSVVTAGYGTSGTVDYITTARESSGATVVAYIPQDGLTPTVAMTNISGTTANAWWYNPQTGAATAIGSYPTSGTVTFTPPDSNDWALVLDDASLNYPPPGGSSLSIKKVGGTLFQLTTAGPPGQIYTLQSSTNLRSSWQTLGTGTADYSGTVSLQVTGAVPSGYYRSVP